MHHQTQPDDLLYVVANTPRDGQIAFGRGLSAKTIAVHELSATHLRVGPSVVFDLDLRKIETVDKLKGILAPRSKGCRIFLIDPSSRVAAANAKVLGANVTLPPSASASDVHAAMRAHFSAANKRPDAETRQSIDAGVEAIDGSFQALGDGLKFSMTDMDAASKQIADAIGGVGVDEWLATVRGYHVGTYQHCMLVTGVASAFGSGSGMARKDIIKLTTAGMLHDIGKAAVPIEILDKPGALTEQETKIMRSHPVIGSEYLTKRSGVAADILSSVRSHHEMLDGTGYPDGLRGDEIDDLTRILTICDIYAALIERRSYKEPKTPEQAMAILNAMANSGKLETSLVHELGRIMLARQAA